MKINFKMGTNKFLDLTKELIKVDSSNEKIYKHILYILSNKKFLKKINIKKLVDKIK